MRALAEGAYFGLCLALGRALRGARYATVRVVVRDGRREVRKRRDVHAPLLVGLGAPLVRVLDAGVRVLPQRAWAERERDAYWLLHGASIYVEGDGTLVLPCLPGRTLAALLEDRALTEPDRARAVASAVAALAALHGRGWTHGDAMAENVLVDLDEGTARWLDFETVHDPRRSVEWRRADDVRALLATCLRRTAPTRRADTVRLILDAYPDVGTARLLLPSFATVLRRALPFHLGQAPLSLRCHREVARLLRARLDA